jgi:hypothetical protein
MSDADENYEPGSPRSSRSSRASNSSSDGIAGLNLDLGSVQAPTGPDLVMPARPGRSANFGQISRLSQYQDHDNMQQYMQQGDDDDDALLRQLLHGDNDNDNDSNPGNVVRRLMGYQIGREIQEIGPQHAEQVLNRIQLPQPRAYNVQELTQMRQRRRDQQQLRQLRIILQNCDRPRLLRWFASIDRAHDARALRRVLQQLDHILEIPQRVINDASRSHSRAFERLFERLRCRTPEARRALHAFISGLRNQIARRLRAMITRRGPPPPQTQSQSQSRKGGKRQTKTKKRAFKRNKTVKRR